MAPAYKKSATLPPRQPLFAGFSFLRDYQLLEKGIMVRSASLKPTIGAASHSREKQNGDALVTTDRGFGALCEDKSLEYTNPVHRLNTPTLSTKEFFRSSTR